MAKKYLQIQIPTPCSEDFSKMTPVEKGHFCNNCEKVVIDFSKMSDQEIANYYKKNGGKLCGRFHHSQLNRDIRLTQPKVNSFFGKAASLILTGVLSAGATNMAAQNLEINPSFSIVDSEVKNENKEEEKTESLKEKIIRIQVVSSTHFNPEQIAVEGASVTHLETQATSLTDSLGVAEIRIPEFCFNEKKLTFTINHSNFVPKELKLDYKRISEIAIFKTELDYLLLVYGGPMFTESDHPIDFPNKLNNEIVRDFDFEIDELDIEEISPTESQKSEDSNSKEKDSIILPPLGVAIKNIFPNPFINKINLEISVEKKGKIQINLVDIAGRIVFQKEEHAERGTQQLQIEVGNLSLSGNMYILQVQDQSGNMQSQQLMRYTNHGFTMR
ncbi:MAG: T9SS type A sorting domain-containing protein [Saprospiraceae bacterium]